VAEVISVNIAEVRTLVRRGQIVQTGIWKLPATGSVEVGPLGLEGDRQIDRRYHGGEDKALYAYAREDIDWWEAQLGRPLENGIFGENLTLRGVDVTAAASGDRWAVGAAILAATDPRVPCWKLGERIGDPAFVKRFGEASRPGIYLRVIKPGSVAAGAVVEPLAR